MAKSAVSALPIKPTKELYGRYYFTKDQNYYEVPDLLEVQKKSYDWFLREGITELLDSISPIKDFSEEKAEMTFLSHSIEAPKYTEIEVRKKNLTYEAPLKVKVQLL